jgi:cytochrome c-type biogenesis protein CcmH
MSAFVVIAALLTLAALAGLIYPLLRRSGAQPVAGKVAGIAAVLLVGGAAGMYPVWSNWNWSQPAVAVDSPAAMVGRLARRLETQPNDLDGWLRLGRSYAVIEQYPLAVRAYQRADRLAGGKNAEALMGLADAMINAGEGEISGRAGRLFEQALTLDPNSVKALFFSAIAAAERNELPLARSRYVRLLEGNPPPEVRRVLEEQVRALDGLTTLTAGAPAAPAASPVAQPATPATQPAPATVTAPAAAVPLHIVMDPKVAARANAGAPLFVLARVPGQRGPPLAAKRLEARFPQELSLLSSDAMIAGMGFTAGQELEIVARVANGGSPIASSGDPVGSAIVKAGDPRRTTIEINRLTP